MTDRLDPLPWVKWFFSDWRADEHLRKCSIGARGFWMECLCLMHKAEPYGHLLINGAVPTLKELAEQAHVSQSNAKRYLEELIAKGVPSRTADGVLFNRRMIRDRRRSERNAANGRQGGSPLLSFSDKRLDAESLKPDESSSLKRNLSESVNPLMSLSVKARARRAPVPEAEAEARSQIPDPSGASHLRERESAPPGEPELDLRPNPSPKPGSAPIPNAVHAFVSRYVDRWNQVRRQQYGRPNGRAYQAAKTLLRDVPDSERLWVMATAFIETPAKNYPYDGARTIEEFAQHWRRVEGELIAAGELPPSAPAERRNG